MDERWDHWKKYRPRKQIRRDYGKQVSLQSGTKRDIDQRAISVVYVQKKKFKMKKNKR